MDLPGINSNNRNYNPNRKIFMTITHLCIKYICLPGETFFLLGNTCRSHNSACLSREYSWLNCSSLQLIRNRSRDILRRRVLSGSWEKGKEANAWRLCLFISRSVFRYNLIFEFKLKTFSCGGNILKYKFRIYLNDYYLNETNDIEKDPENSLLFYLFIFGFWRLKIKC